MTLKMRSKSPKPNQLLSKFGGIPSTGSRDLGTRICHINSPVNSKMRSKSPKRNLLLRLSQLYIQANVVEFHQLVQEICWYKNLSRQRQHQWDPH